MDATDHRIQISGQSGCESFAFPGYHLRDCTAMQDHAPDELHIVVAHIQIPLSRFTTDCKSLFQQVVQGFTRREPAAEQRRLFLERFVS